MFWTSFVGSTDPIVPRAVAALFAIVFTAASLATLTTPLLTPLAA